MISNNPLPLKQRFKEFIIDYIMIVIFLMGVFAVMAIIYFGLLGEIPTFKLYQAQLLAAFGSVIPIVLIFAHFDMKQGTIGKQKAGFQIYYQKKTYGLSVLRNSIKFLPWQIAHMGVIQGIYDGFHWLAMSLLYGSILLGLTMFLMGILRRDKRSLYDFIAKTQVQLK